MFLLADQCRGSLGPDASSGVGLMAATLSQLPPEAVNRQEARHLVDYLTNETCLSAPETLVQALDGLSALAKLPVFGQGDTFQVVRA